MSDSRAYYPGPTVTKKKLVDDVDIPKTGYVQNSKPLQYPPDLENRQLQADNARLRQRNEQLVEFLLSIYNVLTAWKNEEFNTESEAGGIVIPEGNCSSDPGLCTTNIRPTTESEASDE